MADLQSLTVSDTGYLGLPQGTTAQRPSSPAVGYTRWNTDVEDFEHYDGTSWSYVFYDDFETFSGWTTVNSGVVTQSSTQAFEGTFSALKTTNNDPNGARKIFDAAVSRGYEVQCYIFSEEPRAGGDTDRISIVDSSGNGYGLRVDSTGLIVERRDAYAGTTIGDITFTRPSNSWYKIVFKSNLNNTFTVSAYNNSGDFLGAVTSSADTTHTGNFDYIAILGGRNFYVDKISVKK